MTAPTVGAYVECHDHGYRGRVYAVHDHCPESDAWVAGQEVPLTKPEVVGTWFSVLVTGGGAVEVPAARLSVVDPFPFQHVGAEQYFGTSA